jgi:lipid-binding SYLF domain-containing protein
MSRFTALVPTILAAVVLAGFAAGCSSYKTSRGGRVPGLEQEAQTAIARFKEKDPTIDQFFEDSYAYVVFPEVAKGGAGVGGAHGKGVVYRNGEIVGYSTVSQGSIGFQLGGQVFREIIFFKDEHAFNDFKQGNMEFSAQASAVAASKGASADADYESGVAVFTLAKGGLMYEASIGGQKFSFTPEDTGSDADMDGDADMGGDADMENESG